MLGNGECSCLQLFLEPNVPVCEAAASQVGCFFQATWMPCCGDRQQVIGVQPFIQHSSTTDVVGMLSETAAVLPCCSAALCIDWLPLLVVYVGWLLPGPGCGS
jgi:hypothetical protein